MSCLTHRFVTRLALCLAVAALTTAAMAAPGKAAEETAAADIPRPEPVRRYLLCAAGCSRSVRVDSVFADLDTACDKLAEARAANKSTFLWLAQIDTLEPERAKQASVYGTFPRHLSDSARAVVVTQGLRCGNWRACGESQPLAKARNAADELKAQGRPAELIYVVRTPAADTADTVK